MNLNLVVDIKRRVNTQGRLRETGSGQSKRYSGNTRAQLVARPSDPVGKHLLIELPWVGDAVWVWVVETLGRARMSHPGKTALYPLSTGETRRIII